MLNYTVPELALQYAEKLVAYHAAVQSDWCYKDRAVRVARDDMFEALAALNDAAERAAELL